MFNVQCCVLCAVVSDLWCCYGAAVAGLGLCGPKDHVRVMGDVRMNQKGQTGGITYEYVLYRGYQVPQ